MVSVSISDELNEKVPNVVLSCIECDVLPEEENNELWIEIQQKIAEISIRLQIENISKMPAIADSRKAYKACGKDPARYRLSAEALLRRAVKRKEIYQVNNVVDCLNLVSVSSGFSIGGYDAEKINGIVKFGIGRENELYEGIGRGDLNIEFLPVFRDETGPFGSPTSDSVRTAVTPGTRRFLMVIIDFGSSRELGKATELATSLLEKYANAKNIELKTVR